MPVKQTFHGSVLFNNLMLCKLIWYTKDNYMEQTDDKCHLHCLVLSNETLISTMCSNVLKIAKRLEARRLHWSSSQRLQVLQEVEKHIIELGTDLAQCSIVWHLAVIFRRKL